MLRERTVEKNRAARRSSRGQQGQVMNRENDQTALSAPGASASEQQTIVLSPPTEDQEEYLRSIEQSVDASSGKSLIFAD